jgi:carbon monoxide dehydrogenase subunit G
MDRQTVRGSIVIDAPIEYVWDVVNDPATFVEGIDWVFEARSEGDAPLGVGSVYVERAKPGLREGTYRWEITAMDPPHRAVHSHSSGEIEIDLEVTCEALDANSTRYTQVMEYRALPAFRPLGYILERTVMKRQMQRDFDQMILPNYKRIVEQRYQSQ